MPPLHGGKLAAKALKQAGVECIFTLSGGHIMPLYDGCIDEGIRIVDVRHEQAAVHAADAWARCNPGRIGVAAVTGVLLDHVDDRPPERVLAAVGLAQVAVVHARLGEMTVHHGDLAPVRLEDIGDGGVAMFEAVHGTAPDIAGKGIANPSALMLSAAMLLDHVEQSEAADRLRAGIRAALANPESRTGDLGGKANTEKFTDAVIRAMK